MGTSLAARPRRGDGENSIPTRAAGERSGAAARWSATDGMEGRKAPAGCLRASTQPSGSLGTWGSPLWRRSR